MNKISAYIFCFIVIIIGINFIGINSDDMRIKDESVIKEDSYICGIDSTIDTLIIEDVDSNDAIQDSLLSVVGYDCID